MRSGEIWSIRSRVAILAHKKKKSQLPRSKEIILYYKGGYKGVAQRYNWNKHERNFLGNEKSVISYLESCLFRYIHLQKLISCMHKMCAFHPE